MPRVQAAHVRKRPCPFVAALALNSQKTIFFGKLVFDRGTIFAFHVNCRAILITAAREISRFLCLCINLAADSLRGKPPSSRRAESEVHQQCRSELSAHEVGHATAKKKQPPASMEKSGVSGPSPGPNLHLNSEVEMCWIVEHVRERPVGRARTLLLPDRPHESCATL